MNVLFELPALLLVSNTFFVAFALLLCARTKPTIITMRYKAVPVPAKSRPLVVYPTHPPLARTPNVTPPKASASTPHVVLEMSSGRVFEDFLFNKFFAGTNSESIKDAKSPPVPSRKEPELQSKRIQVCSFCQSLISIFRRRGIALEDVYAKASWLEDVQLKCKSYSSFLMLALLFQTQVRRYSMRY
jgi:hypothetical protein